MLRALFGLRREAKVEQEQRPPRPVLHPKLIEVKDGENGDIHTAVRSPSLEQTLHLLKQHSFKGGYLPDTTNDLREAYAGIKISDTFITGQLGCELALAFAPNQERLTGLEGYLFGLAPDSFADAILEFGANLKSTPHLYESLTHFSSLSATSRELGELWYCAQGCRSFTSNFAATVKKTTGAGFCPKKIKVTVSPEGDPIRFIEYTGMAQLMNPKPVGVKDRIITSQEYFVANIGQRLAESLTWEKAWKDSPEEMNLARMAAHFDPASTEAVIQSYVHFTRARF